jgi:hypothetical protein
MACSLMRFSERGDSMAHKRVCIVEGAGTSDNALTTPSHRENDRLQEVWKPAPPSRQSRPSGSQRSGTAPASPANKVDRRGNRGKSAEADSNPDRSEGQCHGQPDGEYTDGHPQGDTALEPVGDDAPPADRVSGVGWLERHRHRGKAIGCRPDRPVPSARRSGGPSLPTLVPVELPRRWFRGSRRRRVALKGPSSLPLWFPPEM